MHRSTAVCCLALAIATRAAAAPACPKPDITFEGAPHRIEGLVWPHSLDIPMLPMYPKSLGAHGPGGMVFIHYVIDRDAHICGPTVKLIDGPKELADITQKWLTTSEFAPAMKNGKPVVAEVKRTLNFAPQSIAK